MNPRLQRQDRVFSVLIGVRPVVAQAAMDGDIYPAQGIHNPDQSVKIRAHEVISANAQVIQECVPQKRSSPTRIPVGLPVVIGKIDATHPEPGGIYTYRCQGTEITETAGRPVCTETMWMASVCHSHQSGRRSLPRTTILIASEATGTGGTGVGMGMGVESTVCQETLGVGNGERNSRYGVGVDVGVGVSAGVGVGDGDGVADGEGIRVGVRVGGK